MPGLIAREMKKEQKGIIKDEKGKNKKNGKNR